MGLSPRRFYFVSGRGPQPWGSLQSTPGTGNQFRNFRTNSGTTDYVALAQPVELAGDFEIEWTGQVSANGGHVFVKFDSTMRVVFGEVQRFILVVGSSQIFNQLILPATLWGDGKLHRFTLSRTGTALTLGVDGVDYSTGTSSESFNIDRLMSKWGSATSAPNYAGVMSDLRITSNGTPIHHWPMSEGSGSTHVDVIGGNSGTIINGQPSDWELFERLPGANFWTGTMSGRILEIA